MMEKNHWIYIYEKTMGSWWDDDGQIIGYMLGMIMGQWWEHHNIYIWDNNGIINQWMSRDEWSGSALYGVIMAVVPPNVRIHRDSRVMNQQTKKKKGTNFASGSIIQWDWILNGIVLNMAGKIPLAMEVCWENHGSKWMSFQQAIFDYRRV